MGVVPQRAVLHQSNDMCRPEGVTCCGSRELPFTLTVTLSTHSTAASPLGLLDFHVCVFLCFCVISAGINEPKIVKCNLFRSLPLG